MADSDLDVYAGSRLVEFLNAMAAPSSLPATLSGSGAQAAHPQLSPNVFLPQMPAFAQGWGPSMPAYQPDMAGRGDMNAPGPAPNGLAPDGMIGTSRSDALTGFGTNDLFSSFPAPNFQGVAAQPSLPAAVEPNPQTQMAHDFANQMGMSQAMGLAPDLGSRAPSAPSAPSFTDSPSPASIGGPVGSTRGVDFSEAGHPNVNAPSFGGIGKGGGAAAGNGGSSVGIGEGKGGPGTGSGHGMGGSAESTGTGGWMAGGYTGDDGKPGNSNRGPVHEKEYVFDDKTTARVGRRFLDGIRKIGRDTKMQDREWKGAMKKHLASWKG